MKTPRLLNIALETRVALAEFPSMRLAMPLLKRAPQGDGHPVMLIPGFLSGESTMHPLRNYLRHLGYDAHTWRLGANFGFMTVDSDFRNVDERFLALYEATGQRQISLVGWSLGGVVARECARRHADKVRQVISLASPFNGDPFDVRSFDILRRLGGLWGNKESARSMLQEILGPLPEDLPGTALFSRTDALVPVENARELPGPLTDNIEVYASHLGIAVNPSVLYAIADRLRLERQEWKPFRRNSRLRKLLYPSVGHDVPAL